MNVLSLFSGIAGLDLGIRQVIPEARTVCWVEADPYCRSVLVARMEDGSLDRPRWPGRKALMPNRQRCEILLIGQNGEHKILGPFFWVAMDGDDIRAMHSKDEPSQIVLRRAGIRWREPGDRLLYWEEVTIRAALAVQEGE